ncbi:hypothetical protein [Deinococcus frigens]|uniref:hypothetical protein n=1 Tax=Deinococcus frigens TaxID=249403 RepID=UPI0012EB96B1
MDNPLFLLGLFSDDHELCFVSVCISLCVWWNDNGSNVQQINTTLDILAKICKTQGFPTYGRTTGQRGVAKRRARLVSGVKLAARPCSMGKIIKKLSILGAVLMTVAVSGFAGATGWGEVSNSGTPWQQVKPPPTNPDGVVVPDPGSSTCNWSQWTETRDVNFSTLDSMISVAACAWIGSRVAVSTAGMKTIKTITNKAPYAAGAGAAGAVAGCETSIEKYITGLDTRTCTRAWSAALKMCETVCGTWH